MREVVQIDELARAKVALHPIRIRLLAELAEPKTCAVLAQTLGMSQQRVNNHLKALLGVKLVRIAERRAVRNLIEATYQAEGKAYWLSPRLLRTDLDARQFRDDLSLHNLLLRAEEVQQDVASLLDVTATQEIPSLGLSVELTLADDDARNRFTQDLLDAIAPVLARYEGPSSAATSFKLMLMCYPNVK